MHCPVNTCAKTCVTFCTEEYIAACKVIELASDEVQIFMAFSPAHFIVLIKQNKKCTKFENKDTGVGNAAK